MKPSSLRHRDTFRKWLEKHHASASELLVGYTRKFRASEHYLAESVDQALCFGWIDGIRRRIDDVSYTIRFAPRWMSGT
jgi:uncharacterized protein YdeI (YjbR/CyaY-like superfamily)